MTLAVEGIVILAAVVIPAVLGMLLVRRLMTPGFRHQSNEHAEPVWAIAGGAFGLLLGFMVVNLWQDLSDAEMVVQEEANDLVNLYELSNGLPASARPQIKADLHEYVRLIVDDEWEKLGKHRRSDTAEAAFRKLWDEYLVLDQTLGASSQSYAESVRHLSEAQDARNRRLNAAGNAVPPVLWVVLLFGVSVMIALIWFTGPERFGSHLLLTLVVAVSLASILFLIRAFNNPFQGDVRADPDPFVRALEHFDERR